MGAECAKESGTDGRDSPHGEGMWHKSHRPCTVLRELELSGTCKAGCKQTKDPRCPHDVRTCGRAVRLCASCVLFGTRSCKSIREPAPCNGRYFKAQEVIPEREPCLRNHGKNGAIWHAGRSPQAQ